MRQYTVGYLGNIQAETPFLAAAGVFARTTAMDFPTIVAVWPIGKADEDSILYFYTPDIVKYLKRRRERFALVG